MFLVMEWKEVESRNVNLLMFSAIIRQETWREVEENNVQHMCGQDLSGVHQERSRHSLPTELTASPMFIFRSFCVSVQSSFPAA